MDRNKEEVTGKKVKIETEKRNLPATKKLS
jgi:hypothetical protein